MVDKGLNTLDNSALTFLFVFFTLLLALWLLCLLI